MSERDYEDDERDRDKGDDEEPENEAGNPWAKTSSGDADDITES